MSLKNNLNDMVAFLRAVVVIDEHYKPNIVFYPVSCVTLKILISSVADM